MAAIIKGVFGPCHNFSSLCTKYSKYLHLLASVTDNLPSSLVRTVTLYGNMIGLTNIALCLRRPTNNFSCVISHSNYKLSSCTSIAAALPPYVIMEDACMLFGLSCLELEKRIH